MRRKDRELTDPEEIRGIIEKAGIVHLGMVDHGRAYVVPLHYGFEFDGDALTLYVHSAREGRKCRVLAENPHVFITLETDVALLPGALPCQYSAAYACVMGEGEARLLTAPEEKVHALRCLMKTQTGQDFAVSEEMAGAVSLYQITVPSVTAKRRPLPAAGR